MTAYAVAIPAVVVALFILMGLRTLYEYQRGVVFRLGKYVGMKNPGLRFIIPFIDQLVKVDLRTIARDVPPQDIITKDNVTVQVNAVVFMRVMNPDKAILEVDPNQKIQAGTRYRMAPNSPRPNASPPSPAVSSPVGTVTTLPTANSTRSRRWPR